jgi:hypothetical protein
MHQRDNLGNKSPWIKEIAEADNGSRHHAQFTPIHPMMVTAGCLTLATGVNREAVFTAVPEWKSGRYEL